MNYNSGRRFINKRNPNLVGHLPGRNKSIRGIFIHSTRSGTSGGDDGVGTENWGGNPGNIGAYWDFLIYEDGQQVKCTVWENDEQPLWAAGYGEVGTWNAQQYYVHVEMAQGVITDPFTSAQMESLAQWIAEMATEYGFAVEHIPFLKQTGEAPEGLCDHENSANGAKLGKTDPGFMFPWDTLIARVKELMKGDDAMTPEEKAQFKSMQEQIYQLQTQLWGENPVARDETHPYADATMFDVANMKQSGSSSSTAQAYVFGQPSGKFKIAGEVEVVQ